MNEIHVAIAIIYFEDKYLLGFRNKQQHQGNRYEFIGGKIEKDESAKEGLIREVKEEIGINLTTDDVINPMGVIRHEYNDLSNNKAENISKTVCLHVFRIKLSKENFSVFATVKQGCEGQSLEWVHLNDLICNKYKLPDANITILQWLKLSDTIAITHDVNNFEIINAPIQEVPSLETPSLEVLNNDKATSILEIKSTQTLINNWVDYYTNKLKKESCVYLRLKSLKYEEIGTAIDLLIAKRPDINLIIDASAASYLYNINQKKIEEKDECMNENNEYRDSKKLPQIFAQHVTSTNLNKLFDDKNCIKPTEVNKFINIPMTLSCHNNTDEINKANKLLAYQLKNNLKPIVGVFISPVHKTKTHTDKSPLGWDDFAWLANLCDAPVIALGGLKPSDLHIARIYGADKVAGIRNF